MPYHFRLAIPSEIPEIWTILQQAIARRKADGSLQWQDGYPNPEVITRDIEKKVGYVLVENNTVIGYCAVLINEEPEYANIDGKWLTNADFIVFHRIAIAQTHIGKGLSKLILSYIEAFALQHGIYSIKADTNFDNSAMLALFKNTGYTYCGEVYFRGSPRKAFEKIVLRKTSTP